MSVEVEVTNEWDGAAGIEQPPLDSGTTVAASGRLTVTRTISEPASASSMTC